MHAIRNPAAPTTTDRFPQPMNDRNHIFPGAVRAVLLLCAVAAYALVPLYLGETICPMKRFLGVPCPGCGSTRAVIRLVHGDIRGAFAMQPFMMAVLVAVPFLAAVSWGRVGRSRTKKAVQSLAGRLSFWIVFEAAAICNWAYLIRNGI